MKKIFISIVQIAIKNLHLSTGLFFSNVIQWETSKGTHVHIRAKALLKAEESSHWASGRWYHQRSLLNVLLELRQTFHVDLIWHEMNRLMRWRKNRGGLNCTFSLDIVASAQNNVLSYLLNFGQIHDFQGVSPCIMLYLSTFFVTSFSKSIY